MWKTHNDFKTWVQSLDSSSIIAERILCEDKLDKYKDYTKKSRLWMIQVMNRILLDKGYDFAV